MTRLWNDRLMWAGEVPMDYPELNPVAFTRMDRGSGGLYPDVVDPAHSWQLVTQNTVHQRFWDEGDWAQWTELNIVNPATSQSKLSLPYFTGMWPGANDRLLIGLWHWNSYTMSFNPLAGNRNGGSGQPLAYLSTRTYGDPRVNVYDSAGNSVLDQRATPPWGLADLGWLWYGMYIDMAAQTAQLVGAKKSTRVPWIGPVFPISAAPNPGSQRNFDVYGLDAGYWTSGGVDEILLAHPGEDFDLEGFVTRMARGQWGTASAGTNPQTLEVSDGGVSASDVTTFLTGAEQVTWERTPNFIDRPANSTWFLSTNDGATWTSPATLPETFTGLMRWEIQLLPFEQFSGMDLIVPAAPPPTLQPIPDVTMQQNGTENRPLTFTITGPATWGVQNSGIVEVTQVGNTLVIEAGWEIGTDVVTVTLTDQYLQSTSRVFTVEVTPADAPPPDVPIYPRAPIILHNDDGVPWEVLAYPLKGVIKKETDGEDTFTFELFADDPQIDLIRHEEYVTCAGETYRIRRITDTHRGSQLLKTVYCEALFYDLATARQIDGREWQQTTAGAAMQFALEDTGWTVGIANVSTLRTYEHEDTNPLEFLRFIRSQHGGELIFDNLNKTVSLLTSSGRDTGTTFFYGHGLSEAKRVVDTTSLVTRIYAKNEEGVTIASVNNGLDYIEDFSFTNEVKTATYDFKSGTSPYTMLSMASATLANRAQPDVAYEVVVDDLSRETGQELDRFNVRDYVRVVDESIALNTLQRIVGIEYDVIRPWNSRLSLGSRLREIGSDTDTVDSGTLTTGAGVSTFDLVPYNLIMNSRFDTAMAHWANFGVVIEQTKQGTGDYAAVFRGAGERWIEQTVTPDNRDSYALSLDVASEGGPQGWVPNLVVTAVVTYEDGTTETIEISLT